MVRENKMAVRLYGNSPQIEEYFGLDVLTCRKITAIIIYSGNIEYYLERAIWRLKNVEPEGTRPETDTKNITKLLSMFQSLAPESDHAYRPHWIVTWCKAAKSAFDIRNNIAHGFAHLRGETMTFMRNPRWEGEERKRAFGDFWCQTAELEMTADSFATLVRMIMEVERNQKSLAEIGNQDALRALNEAKSILGEFSDPNFVP